MKPFYRGFLLGYLFKEHINNILSSVVFNILNVIHKVKTSKHSKITNGISKINLVLKITNQELFDELLQPLPNWWKYFPEKKVIKVELHQELIDFIDNHDSLTFEEVLESVDKNDDHIITLDIPLFKTIGEIYLYVTYFVDSQKFINVYSQGSYITSNDFKTKEQNGIDNILCSSVKYDKKTEYITNYLKLFYNTYSSLTPELLLLNYDKINTDLKSTSLLIIKDKCIREYSYTETLN
jgi:hypothetical protein